MQVVSAALGRQLERYLEALASDEGATVSGSLFRSISPRWVTGLAAVSLLAALAPANAAAAVQAGSVPTMPPSTIIQTPSGKPSPAPARTSNGRASPPTPASSKQVQAAASTSSAYASGDVFAGLGNGTLNEYSSGGTLRNNLAASGSPSTGMCFDGAGNLYSTQFGGGGITQFNNLGSLISSAWAGSGVPGGAPESCVVNNNQDVFVGAADSGALSEFSPTGTLLNSWHPASQDRGLDWIDLSGDQCTMLYSSEGTSVKAFNVCTGQQLADFATGLPGNYCFQLRILANGQVAIACNTNVVVLSPAGAIVRTYTTASIGDTGNYLFAFNLTPDNTAFWTADINSGDIYEVSFATGAVLQHIAAGQGVDGLAVFGEGGAVGTPLMPSETLGGGSLDERNVQCSQGQYPVNCATGDFWHTFSDVATPGRGVPLGLSRTYNSLSASTNSPFGYGWSSSYGLSLSVDSVSGVVTVVQENGSTNTFTPNGSGGYFTPPRVEATLTKNGDGTFTFLRQQRQTFTFSATGQLTAESDLNGDSTTLAYNGSMQLSTVTDPAGRTLSFTYGTNGDLANVTDSSGRTVNYSYNAAGNLIKVIDVAGGTTSFTYDPNHLLLTLTDPNGGVVTNTYDGQGRVTDQADPMGRHTSYAYSATGTTITDPNGNKTDEGYSAGELTSLTKGAGTPSAATTTYAYDQYTLGVTAQTDPLGHVTTTTYDPNGNQLSKTDPLGRTTSYTYDSLNDRTSQTDPLGVTTTYTYDSHGNLLTTSTPLSGSQNQVTTLAYGDSGHPGDITASTDPNGNATSYSYDADGNQTKSTDPDGRITTYTYDGLGRRLTTVTPAGNVSGGNPTMHTISYTYDAFGDRLTMTDQLGHLTTYGYDADRNHVSTTDPAGHTSSTAYDLDNEPTIVTQPDGTKTTTAYDADGNTISQTNAAGKTTTYRFDALDRASSSTDPLGKTTRYGYDVDGNRLTVTDPDGRVTTNSYDAANELTGVSYSDGKTPAVSYTYDADGQRAAMADGTGTTTYTTDALHRLNKTVQGSGATVSYTYDLGGDKTAVGYPDGRSATYTYDPARQITSVTDQLGKTTTYTYDADGNSVGQAAPNGVTDTSSYNNADQLGSVTDATSSGNLATFNYQRNNDGLVTNSTTTGANATSTNYSYSALNQVTNAGNAAYNYDPAGNITTPPSTGTASYNAASELTSQTAPAPTSYTYNNEGQRTSTATAAGTANYSYDQAGRLSAAPVKPPPSSGGAYVPLPPTRVCDTRAGNPSNLSGLATQCFGHTVAAGATLPVAVAGSFGVPANATAVVVNVTGVMPATSQAGYVTVFPAGGQVPTASNLNLVPGQIAPNLVQVGLGSGGAISIFSLTKTDVVVDVEGYVLPAGSGGSLYNPLPGPVRVCDTRTGNPSGLSGTAAQCGGQRLAAGTTKSVTVAGAFGVPAGATAVVANLTAVNPSNLGYLVAFANGSSTPTASNVNYTTGQIVPNRVVIPVGANGKINIATNSATDVVLDVTGYYSPSGGSGYVAAPPTRICDTRTGNPSGLSGTAAQCNSRRIGPGQTLTFQVTGNFGVPAGATAAALNVTGISPSAPITYLTVFPGGSPPTTSDLNLAAGDIRPNLVIATLAPSGTVSIFNQTGNTDIAVDLAGWYVPPAPPSPAATYTYNGDGLRAAKTVGSATSIFTYDTSGGLPLLLSDGSNDFVYGANNLPIEQITGGTVTYLSQDQQGSTTLLTDTSGKAVGSYAYDAYGNVTSHTGASTPLGYDSQYTDAETGFIYLDARYYDPATAQFITADPITSLTGQQYSYSGNDPLNASDPSGLFCILGHNSNGSCRGSQVTLNVANKVHGLGTIVSDVGVGIIAFGGGGADPVADIAGLIVGEVGSLISLESDIVTCSLGKCSGLTVILDGIDAISGGLGKDAISGAIALYGFANFLNSTLSRNSGSTGVPGPPICAPSFLFKH